jgi:hypothetical protein
LVALLLAGGCVQGCGAVPGRESVSVGEPADVAADVGERAGGTGGSDAVQVHQRGAAGDHQLGEVLRHGPDLLVDALEFDDQLDHEPAVVLPTMSLGLMVAINLAPVARPRWPPKSNPRQVVKTWTTG